jgi:hypothetical protein
MTHSQFKISIGSRFKVTLPRKSCYFPKSRPYGRSRTVQDIQKRSIATTTTTIHEKRNLKQLTRTCSNLLSKQLPRQHCRHTNCRVIQPRLPCARRYQQKELEKQVTIDSSPRTLGNVSDNPIAHVALPDREKTIR